MKDLMGELSSGPIAEKALFQTRLKVLTKEIGSEEAIMQYESAIMQAEAMEQFYFQSEDQDDRIDSYYDPFGQVSVKARLYIELAREYQKLENQRKVNELKERILGLSEWTKVGKLQLEGYWEDHVLRSR